MEIHAPLRGLLDSLVGKHPFANRPNGGSETVPVRSGFLKDFEFPGNSGWTSSSRPPVRSYGRFFFFWLCNFEGWVEIGFILFLCPVST